MKKIATLMALFVVSLFAVSMVSAAHNPAHPVIPVTVEEVQVNGNVMNFGDPAGLGSTVLFVEKGDDVNVQVRLFADAAAQDVELEASIRGYEYGDYQSLTDQTHVFDIEAGTTYYKSLQLTLPNRLDNADHLLRIRVTDRASDVVSRDVTLRVRPVRHGIDIRDVVFSPGMTVEAGRSLLATVQLENFGQKSQDDVKVTLSLDELGVNAYDFVDVDNGGANVLRKTSEELFVQVPRCAAAGEYTARVTAEFDDFESVSRTFTINVLENGRCEAASSGRLQLTVGQSQSVAQGQQGTFPVALVNMGIAARTYTLDVAAGQWATTSLSQSLVVLQPGQTEVVYAYVTADSQAPAGEQPVSLTVRGADGNVLETVTLTTNVVPAAKQVGLRNGLEVALIVLVVLLVVIGLIVGFSRLKRDEDADEEQTYY
tara:strand:+ start:332 stop:1615 length:1284 start_codon:yes stop_codon:yes gene_type:complete